MLRQIFLKSIERSETMKRDNYTCVKCFRKQSQKKGHEIKINVHHKKGINWELILNTLKKELLCDIEDLEVLCVDCHHKE